jgi:hypothetical protein
MNLRYFSFVLATVLLMNSIGFAHSNILGFPAEKRVAANRLVSMLPASDGIAVIDSKRFFSDSLPKVLSANQPMIGQIAERLNEMQSRTGIDLRKFDQMVVGVVMKQVSSTEVDYDTVALASGDINGGALAKVAELASKGSYREEKVGSRTVYIFAAKDAVAQTSRPATGKLAGMMDRLLSNLANKEVAVSTLDSNTLVIGSPQRVRQTLGAKNSGLDADVRAMLPVRETAVVSFAARTNGLLTKVLPVEADALGANLDSIQYLTGFLEVGASTTTVNLNARTKTPEQAIGLKDTIAGLQMVGSAIFGNSKRPDQQVYGRMLKNAKIASRGSDVSLDVAVAQTDIDTLIAEGK